MKPGFTAGKLAEALRLVALMFCFLLSTQAHAQVAVSEYQLKAAFLFKFPEYVDWPPELLADNARPLTFGVIGSQVMLGNLQTIVSGQSFNGRAIRVVSLQPDAPLTGIHVVFVGNIPGIAIDMILQEAVSQSVLTVTEMPGVQPSDSMINFVVSDNRVRFDIALPPAETASLKFSARLLQVARSVVRGEP